MWYLFDINGFILAVFDTDTDAYEASYDTDTYPDAYEVAYVNDWEDICANECICTDQYKRSIGVDVPE